MAGPLTSYSIFPLGDAAITLELGSSIDELHNIRALTIRDWLEAHRFPGMLDIIVAYGSVSVFYDPAVLRGSGVVGSQTAAAWVEGLMNRGFRATISTSGDPADAGHSFRIPVCYEGEYAPDLAWVAQQRGLSADAVIELHTAAVYRVYMIGFLPGFPYLGTVDQRLEVPRKTRPVPVAAGGVGIAGLQTGIYTLNSPGGWSIIGRTPTTLFDPEGNPPVRLQTGDRVQFYPISAAEFRNFHSVRYRSPFK